VRAANDGLRFLLELATLAAASYWGFHEFDGAVAVLAGLGAPIAIAAVWGVWMAPRSDRRVADPARLVLEVVIFGSGVAALAAAGPTSPAVVLGAMVVLHLVLTFALDQRTVLT
jgi:hypothetical protein